MSNINEENEIKSFDCKNVFNSEIEQKLLELEKLCNRYKIPMFFTAAIMDNGEKTEYYTKVLQPLLYNYSLKDDKFSDFINVMNGFQTYYKPKTESVNEDDYTKILKGVMKDDE